MSRLTPDLAAYLGAGLAHQVGACGPDGQPWVVRALGALADDDGGVSVLLSALASPEALAAIAATRQVALVLCQPSTLRTILLKGADAVVETVDTPPWRARLAERHEAFFRDVSQLGFQRELLAGWYDVPEGQLARIRFTPYGAWNQTPGPGAGGPVELLP